MEERQRWLSLPLAASAHQPVLTALQVRQTENVLLSYQPLICRAAHLKAGFPIRYYPETVYTDPVNYISDSYLSLG